MDIKLAASILKQSGYQHHFDRDIYYNCSTKKIFSRIAIEDHDDIWLHKCITAPGDTHWQFYFNLPLDAVATIEKIELEKLLNNLCGF